MKNRLCAYYTNSDEITSYMINQLRISNNDRILEPSAGEGVFIDKILKAKIPIRIDALDIDKKAISTLKIKYKDNMSVSTRETDMLFDDRRDLLSSPEIWIKKTDTLIDEQLDYFKAIDGYYDKVIGNPPYGAWQDYEKRDLLKKKYPGQYVKETYSLFLLRCISILKMGGRLSFIIPDTYMFLNRHSKLRKILLTTTKIEEIITFPANFFPGISFGYSKLSIITLERTKKEIALNNSIRIVQGFQSTSEFRLLSKNKSLPTHLSVYTLNQSELLNYDQHRFIIADEKITNIISKASTYMGDIADIVTGFYSGDNKRFIRALESNMKGSKGYKKINLSLVFPCTSIRGIEGVSEGYIPYIKSSSATRYCRLVDEWFVRWDKETINYYINNKKSRFQNSVFYFKTGIAIPMIKSTNIKAFLIENRVFDQSIVGIFPKDHRKLYYILALMNSSIINNLIHTINPTANNSANYIKQIPYIEPSSKIVDFITIKVKSAIELLRQGRHDECEKIHRELNNLIFEIYTNSK